VTEQDKLSEEEELRLVRNTNRFDIRRLIGGLFIVYGVILTLLGLFGSFEVKNKAAGINVDLWAGIGLLIFGGLMVFWALSRPVMPEREQARGEGSEPARQAPAT
jgi:hypothetical protein